MKRMPLTIIQEAVYGLLTRQQSIPLYDKIPQGAKLPFMTFGDFTCKGDGAKDVEISTVTIEILIHSNYDGKKQTNAIAENVTEIFGKYKLNLKDSGFIVMEKGFEFYESTPEENFGYLGILTFYINTQDVKGVAS